MARQLRVGDLPLALTADVRRMEALERIATHGAAFSQGGGIAGHTPASAVRSALLACASFQGVDTVLFWSLGWLRRSPDVAATITALRRR